ncbi:MAG: hypothetical protein II850_09535 [Fibrobacter sp.]|nr:hypothetical protein [Fibrobacter sp.]
MSEFEEVEKKLEDDIVRRQHYVPRCYLKAWVDVNEHLECQDKTKMSQS